MIDLSMMNEHDENCIQIYIYIYIYISFFFISLSENRWHQEMNDWGIKPVSFSPQEALKKLQQVATHPITTISKLGWYV